MAMPLSSAALQFPSSRPSFSPFRSISATSSSFLPSALPYSNHNSGSLSISSSRTTLKVICGRGDRRTKKGKRFAHTYGNARPRNKSKGKGPLSAPTPINPYKKIYESEFTEDDYKGLEFVEPPSRRAKEDDGDDDE